eukprot:5447878-Prymnesium_polylepis.2
MIVRREVSKAVHLSLELTLHTPYGFADVCPMKSARTATAPRTRHTAPTTAPRTTDSEREPTRQPISVQNLKLASTNLWRCNELVHKAGDGRKVLVSHHEVVVPLALDEHEALARRAHGCMVGLRVAHG